MSLPTTEATLDNVRPGTPLVYKGAVTYARTAPAKDGQLRLDDGTKTHIYEVRVLDVEGLIGRLDVANSDLTDALARIDELEARPDPEPEVVERVVDPNPALKKRIAELEGHVRKLMKVRKKP